MDNNQKQGSSSSTMNNFDQFFGPKDPSSTSSSSIALFGSIFPPSSSVGGRDYSRTQDVAGKHFAISGKSKSSGMSNKNESVVEPNYYSSSIYYGGQEIYSPRSRTTTTATTTPPPQPHRHAFKKDKEDDDPNGSDPNSASRGNWWQGSLYY